MTSTSFIADNWYWILAAGASGGMLLWQQVKEGSGAGLTPAAAVQLMNKDKAQVIDVCEPAEFAAGHVSGAKNIPLSQIGAAKGLPSNKATPLIVVCAAGVRSAKAAAQRKQMGYENVQSLAGGLKAWREAGLPVNKG